MTIAVADYLARVRGRNAAFTRERVPDKVIVGFLNDIAPDLVDRYRTLNPSGEPIFETEVAVPAYGTPAFDAVFHDTRATGPFNGISLALANIRDVVAADVLYSDNTLPRSLLVVDFAARNYADRRPRAYRIKSEVGAFPIEDSLVLCGERYPWVNATKIRVRLALNPTEATSVTDSVIELPTSAMGAAVAYGALRTAEYANGLPEFAERPIALKNLEREQERADAAFDRQAELAFVPYVTRTREVW